MADPFEVELQSLVNKVVRQLSQDITRLILRKLGLKGALPARRGKEPVSTRSVGRVLRQAEQARPKGTTPGLRPARASPRARPSADERAERYELVAAAVGDGAGLSVADIARKSGLSRASVTSALKVLKGRGEVFMGGTKRFARYAMSQALANKASVEARGGANESSSPPRGD